jgi:photosystem II stability/assembly factor-like uncharacterized protein
MTNPFRTQSIRFRPRLRLVVVAVVVAASLAALPLVASAVQTDGWATQTSGTTSDLYSIACPSSTTCFAVGAGGAIRATTDGTTWSAQTSPTTQLLYNISCVDTTHCYASGAAGTIIATSNGSTWATQTSNTTSALYGIACSSTTTCAAVGAGGVIRATNNSGGTWNTLTSGVGHDLYSISCASSTNCVVVGDLGQIDVTTNGTSWTSHMTGSALLHDVWCTSTTDCVAVGVSGTIVTTTNDGTSWTSRTSGTSSTLYTVSCVSATVCFASGASGLVLKSGDGGTTWASETSNTTQNLVGSSFPTTIDGWASGFGGTIDRFDACGGASLALTVPSTISWSVTLNGADQTTSSALVLTADDESGARAGWNITGTSTTFKNAGSKLLPTTATSLTSSSAVAATGNCNTPANSIAYPVTLPAATVAPTAVKLYNATAGTGRGPTTVTLNFNILEPANIFSGTYTSTWTMSIVSGP